MPDTEKPTPAPSQSEAPTAAPAQQKDPRSCRPCFAANIAKLAGTEELAAIARLAELSEERRPTGTAFVRLVLDAAGYPTGQAPHAQGYINALARNGWQIIIGQRLKAGDVTVDADGNLEIVAKARLDSDQYWVLRPAPDADRFRSGLYEIAFALRHPGA